MVVVDDNERAIGMISLSDLLLYLVLRPCGEELPDGLASVRAQVHSPIFFPTAGVRNDSQLCLQDLRQQETHSQSSKNSSCSNLIVDEATCTIPEEEDEIHTDASTTVDGSPEVLEKLSLHNDAIFTTVAVSGGD